MITTKITVEPHLAQYCYAKYSSDRGGLSVPLGGGHGGPAGCIPSGL
mgnify:CR=1 FL=1